MISMICVIGRNREIGFKNRLLWDLPGDMNHFISTTRGKTVIMGQNTYNSLYVKPLPNRNNIVLTLDDDFDAPGCETSRNLEEIVKRYKKSSEEVFVIGGASIYKQFLLHTSKLYLTIVDDAPRADTYFPDYSNFKKISKSEKIKENGISYEFCEFDLLQ